MEECWRVSPAPDRQQKGLKLFQNGVGFDIEVVLKHDPTQAFFTDTHIQTHCPAQNGTSTGLNSDEQEVNFVQFIQGYYTQ